MSLLFPTELWKMILSVNYDMFCVNVSRTLPWNCIDSYLSPLIKESILGHLILKSNINSVDNEGLSVLHLACGSQWSNDISDQQRYALIKRLIDRANIGALCHEHTTPLHFACTVDQPTVVQLLIDCGADINAIDNDGWTPLHFASQTIQTDWNDDGVEIPICTTCNNCSVLIENGANVNIATNAFRNRFNELMGGETALHIVCEFPIKFR